MRVAIYSRVSTDEQAQEGFSIPAQKDKLTAFVHSQDWDIFDYYIDEGVSGKDIDRPELQRLLSDVKNRKIDIVLVYRLDRLTRSVLDLYKLLQEFDKHEVKFKSATEIYDTTTAIGRLFITLVAALAQWERENLGERVRFGMEQMIKEGRRPGGPIPYGYNQDGELIPEEATILRRIRQLYLGGEGYWSIARKLNAEGVLKRNVKWSSFSIYYVLENPYYAGQIRWGGKKTNGKYATRKKEERVECIIHQGDHEAVFSLEEYQECIDYMKKRQFYSQPKSPNYWFSGVLRCGRCGSSMSGKTLKRKSADGSDLIHINYFCAQRQQGQGCDMPMFRQRLVEELIMDHLAQVKIDHKNVKKLAKESTKKKTQLDITKNDLEKQLLKIADRKKKWQYAYVEELITVEELRKRTIEERELETQLINELAIINSQVKANVSNSDVLELMIELPDLWNVLGDHDKNKIIRTIFSKVVLNTPVQKVVARKGKPFPALIELVEYN
ncbi:recombinase family protein [Brevibacterium sp. JNUCC-42]|nr:recombinase family protein [Brevibacterium sp. JNUCC-42]